MSFQKLPEIVNRFLMPPEPVILHYIIDPSVLPPERPQAYDVEVKMEDTALKGRMAAMLNTSKETAANLQKMDEEVSCCPPSISTFFGFGFLTPHRLHFSLNPSIIHTSREHSYNPLRKTQLTSFKFGWSHNREIWRPFLAVEVQKA
jgi:hypothetical protein